MPNLFTRSFVALAQKLNPAWLHLSSFSDMPQAIRMNKNFKTYVKEGYKNSDTLYKCISYLIRNGSAIPPVLYTDATRQKTIDSHPLLDKLNKPNNEQSGVAYREAVLGYKLLAGNSFQYAIRAGKNAPPDELWPLRPDRVQIQIIPKVGIIGYKYEDLDQPIPAENIGHTKYWNPDDDNEQGMGMSPVEAASLNIDMQIAGKKWNLGLLQNGARPQGIWKVPMLIGANERQKLEDKLNEKMAGAKGAGKSPLFDGGLDWKPTGLAPAQMDYLDSLKYNGGSIANILNMAPQLVGDNSSTTYDNMKQAKVWSYTEGIFPELDDLYALWNNWLVPMYPDLCDAKGNATAYLYYDKESVEVIQELIQAQKDSQAERANDLWLNGIAMQNEARVLAGLPEVAGGNVFRIGAVLVPVEKLQEYAEQSLTTPAAPPPALPEPLDVPQPTPGNEDEDDGHPQPGHADPVPANPAGRTGDKSHRAGLHSAQKALDLETTEQKQAYAKSVEESRERWYTKAESRLQTYFKSEQQAVVKAINNAALPSTAAIRAESALKQQNDPLKEVLVKLWQDVGTDMGSQVVKAFKSAGSREQKDAVQNFIDMFGEQVLVYLLKLAGKKIKEITDSTLAQIQSELSDGVAAGESIPELAKRIDTLYLEQIIPNRSKVIARTEVVGASNWSAIQAAKSSGLTLNKVWLATEDNRTRETHADADGQEVAMDEKFTVGGVEMDQPGDPTAPAEEVIQCRCTVYFKRVKQDASPSDSDEKRVISLQEKRRRTEEYRRFMEEVLV
jgi:HK97 family phage portal protein